MGKMTKKNKSQSLAKHMNSNTRYLNKIREQCTPGTLYTVIDSDLQTSKFGNVLTVSLTNSKNNKVTKTFLTASTVRKLNDYFRQRDGEVLNNQSILGAVFKYVGEVKMNNGYTFSKLDWIEQEMD